jgi:hypothetical protein
LLWSLGNQIPDSSNAAEAIRIDGVKAILDRYHLYKDIMQQQGMWRLIMRRGPRKLLAILAKSFARMSRKI